MSFLRTGSAALAAVALATPALAADSYTIDAVHSQVVFRIKHMGVSYNYGTFDKLSGSYVIDGANSSIELTIDAASVDTSNAKRDEHLRGTDFFNAKEFPSITFKSKSVKGSGDTWEVAGDLTYRGVTKPLTAKVVKVGEAKGMRPGEYRSGFEATFTIKRSDFGDNYGTEMGALGDEVALMVNIEGVKN